MPKGLIDDKEDPEFGDPDDPDWRHELFRLMRVMGKTPEDVSRLDRTVALNVVQNWFEELKAQALDQVTRSCLDYQVQNP